MKYKSLIEICRTKKCKKCNGRGVIIDPIKLGRFLRKARELNKVSLRELARRIGVSAPYIVDLELGRRPLNEGMFRKCAKEIAK